MTITIEAIYENGVLKPTQPLPLQEHEKVQVTISSPSNWVQETAGKLGWKGTSEELAAFALDPEFEYALAPESSPSVQALWRTSHVSDCRSHL